MGWQTQSVVQLFAGNTIINPNGTFVYSSAPAVGNLIASSTPSATTQDNFGNKVIGGAVASYASGFAAALAAGSVQFFTGTLAAGWTFVGQMETDVGGDILLVPNGIVSVSGNMTVTGNGTFTGTLSVNGSTSTGVPSNNNTSQNGLTDGTINGTSGPASAGTAHTHTPGSFAVANGQHTHNLNSHLHVL